MIAIIDYDAGNIRSVEKALIALGEQPVVTRDKDAILAADKLILPEPAANSRPSWFGFLISVKPESGLDRNAVTRYVESHNVQTRLLFSGNLIKHPCFDQMRGTDAYRVVGELTNTDFIMNNTFWVGVYPGMTDEMIDYMAKTIIEAVNQ